MFSLGEKKVQPFVEIENQQLVHASKEAVMERLLGLQKQRYAQCETDVRVFDT